MPFVRKVYIVEGDVQIVNLEHAPPPEYKTTVIYGIKDFQNTANWLHGFVRLITSVKAPSAQCKTDHRIAMVGFVYVYHTVGFKGAVTLAVARYSLTLRMVSPSICKAVGRSKRTHISCPL